MFTKIGSNLYLYIDGDINKGGTTVDTTVGNTTNNFPVYLGARENISYFKGEIDDLKIYDYGMSQSEIQIDYKSSGYYISNPKKISETPTKNLKWNSTNTLNTFNSIQYRTAPEQVVWRNDFDDNSISEYVGDFYGWGEPFNDAIEGGGTMKISNPTPYVNGQNNEVDFWIDTGEADGHFPIGSIVEARVKVNSNREPSPGNWGDYMYNDDWYDETDGSYIPNNTWQILTFTASERAFSKIGFDLSWKTGTWDDINDNFEIDWIKIVKPIANWSSWSSPCTNSSYCPINQSDLTGKTWIQYKMSLSTSNISETPIIDSVSYVSGYQENGEYISSVLDGSKKVKWKSMTVGSNIPTNTSLNVLTRTGSTLIPDSSWSDWMTFTNKQTGRYLQYKVTLATTDENLTPTLSDISFSYDFIVNTVKSSSSSSSSESISSVTSSSVSSFTSSSTSSLEVIETTKEITIKDENGNVLKNTVVTINGKTYTTDSKGKVKAEVAGVYVIEYDKGGVKYASTIKSSESIATLKAQPTPNILIYIVVCIAGILVLGIIVLLIRRRKKE